MPMMCIFFLLYALIYEAYKIVKGVYLGIFLLDN